MAASFSQLYFKVARVSIPIFIFFTFYIVFSISFSQNSRSLSTNPQTTNVSHLLFGIAGSRATWNNRSQFVSQWWKPNITRGFVWLDSSIGTNSTILDHPPCRVASPEWKRYNNPTVAYMARIARILIDSFDLHLPNVRWFVLGDDDTVFFVDNLVSVLASYDHDQMWYIGGNSESVQQNVRHLYMAFGGGGIVISFPLAQKLVTILDSCLDRYSYMYGADERTCACMAEIGVPLTTHRGFHQMDIKGNPYGILAAHPLVPIVSLHHLDYIDPLYPNMTRSDALMTALSAYESDPRQFLQQSFCYSNSEAWSISISWGYTVQLYPFLLMPVDLQKPIQTWAQWSFGDYTFNTRPVSEDPCQLPVVFMFEGVQSLSGRGLLSSYKNMGVFGGKSCGNEGYTSALAIERIVVLGEKYGEESVKESPRRQCCQVIEKKTPGNRSMQLHVSKCASSDIRAEYVA